VPQDHRSQARLVSKPFFNAVELSHFSLGLILPSEMEQLARVFGRYKKPIRLSFKKTKKLTVEDMKHLTAITQLTAFSTACEVDGSTLVCLTNLLSLHVRLSPRQLFSNYRNSLIFRHNLLAMATKK
jgi:hypothetical protein